MSPYATTTISCGACVCRRSRSGTADLAEARALIGPGGARRGEASAHFGVGRSLAEGIDRWVDLEHRSWHAGKAQTLDLWGRPSTDATKAARTTIGIETAHPGYAREDVPDGPDFTDALDPTGRPLRIAPWPMRLRYLSVSRSNRPSPEPAVPGRFRTVCNPSNAQLMRKPRTGSRGA